MTTTKEPWYTMEIEIKEGQVDAFLELFRSLSEATRREPGVLQYDLLQDLKNPRRFNLVQRYASYEAVRFHMDQDYVKKGLVTLAGMFAKPYLQTDYMLVV
jgi:autoinducer 2-degrading protein